MSALYKLNNYQAVTESNLKTLTMPLYFAGIPKKLVCHIMYLQCNYVPPKVIDIENFQSSGASSLEITVHRKPSLPLDQNPTVNGTGVVDLTL
jgi:hypothetical protein